MIKPVKKAFIVIGPEGSGTRMLTQLLIEAGCIGEATHAQALDSYISGKESPIVWRKSVPHGRENPNLYEMSEQLRKLNYDITVVVIVRNFIPTAGSQVRRKMAMNEEHAIARIQMAMRHITDQILKSSLRAYYVTYESLNVPGAVQGMLRFLGLNPDITFQWKNADGKYYQPNRL